MFTHKKSAPQLLVVESNFWGADQKDKISDRMLPVEIYRMRIDFRLKFLYNPPTFPL